MASKNLAGLRLAAHLLDHGLTPEEFGDKVGLSGMTIRRVVDGHPCFLKTKFLIARELREDPSSLWPPIPTRRPKVVT